MSNRIVLSPAVFVLWYDRGLQGRSREAKDQRESPKVVISYLVFYPSFYARNFEKYILPPFNSNLRSHYDIIVLSGHSSLSSAVIVYATDDNFAFYPRLLPMERCAFDSIHESERVSRP